MSKCVINVVAPQAANPGLGDANGAQPYIPPPTHLPIDAFAPTDTPPPGTHRVSPSN
jgi:hypothetical protein